MNTQLLKYALEVEKTGSITQAAKRLYMNQPHLSKAIRELETTFHIVLFHRTAKGMIPTQEGEQFLAYAREVLAILSKMETFQQAVDSSDAPQFRFASTHELHIVYALSQWIQSVPSSISWNVSFYTESPLLIVDSILEQKFRWGILCYPVFQESFVETALMEKDFLVKPLWKFQHKLITSQKVQKIDDSFYANAIPIQLKSIEHFHASQQITLPDLLSSCLLIKNHPRFYMTSSPLPQEIISLFDLQQHTSDQPCCKEVLVIKKGYELSEEEKSFLRQLGKLEKELS